MNLLVLAGCSGSPSSPEPAPAPVPEAPAPAPAPAAPPEPQPAEMPPGHGTTPVGTIPPGTTGVIVVAGTDLLVIFPASQIEGFDPKAVPPVGAAWQVLGDLTVFGAKGVQAQMPAPAFAAIRWCKDEYRLEGRVPMPGAPPREVMVSPDNNVLSFVRVGEAGLVAAPSAKDVLGSGDVNGDGKPEAHLAGKVELITAKGKSPLKCGS